MMIHNNVYIIIVIIEDDIEPEEDSSRQESLPFRDEPAKEIITEIIPTVGDVEKRINKSINEKEGDDGIIIRTHTTTIEHYQPVYQVKKCGDREIERRESTQLIGTEIHDDITKFPVGAEDFENRCYGVSKNTTVTQSDQTNEDGTWLKNVTTVVVVRVEENEPTVEIIPKSNTIQQRVHEEDDSTENKDGTTIKIHITTTTHFREAFEITKRGDIEIHRKEVEQIVGTEISEDVLETPPGVEELNNLGQSVSRRTTVKETEGVNEGGDWFTKKTTTTSIIPLSNDEVQDFVSKSVEHEEELFQQPSAQELTIEVIPVNDNIQQRSTEHDSEEHRDGIIVQKHVTTTIHFKDAFEVERSGDEEVARKECEQLIGTKVEVNITEIPEGVDINDETQSFTRKTSEQQSEKTESDGTWYVQTTITTTITPSSSAEEDESVLCIDATETVEDFQETQPDGTVITKRVVIKRVDDTIFREIYIVFPDGNVVLDMQTQHGIIESLSSDLIKKTNISKPISFSENDGFDNFTDYRSIDRSPVISKVADEITNQV